MYTEIRLLILVYPVISSFFCFSNFQLLITPEPLYNIVRYNTVLDRGSAVAQW